MPNANFVGGTWSPDGEVIVFGAYGGNLPVLCEVPARGGTPNVVVSPEDQPLPGTGD